VEEKELLKLIDKYIDEVLTIEETEEFNDLLECSKDFRDLFRKRIKLHGDLANHYDATNIPGITPFEKPKPENNKPIIFTILTAVAAIAVFAFVVINPQTSTEPQYFASIAFEDKARLISNEKLYSEKQLSKGTYKLESGMFELQMPNEVVLAIEAPTEFTIDNEKRISLASGKVSANVGEAGRGFEVITPDGKIIDLGTRFGVSVSDNGKTEAHVFEGEINVVASSKTTKLIQDQAILLEEGAQLKEMSADQSSFPLPGFPIKANISNLDFEEEKALLIGWPKKAAVWGGDHGEQVEEHLGVKPMEGSKMLQFVKPYAKGARDENQNVCQIWQVIDLKSFDDEIRRGGVTARLSAFFNTADNLTVDDNSFSISLVAFNGDIEEIKKYWDNQKEPLSEMLGSTSHNLKADLDSNTWEKSELNFQIPAGTDFLLLQLAVNAGAERKLEGHFADNIILDIATVPRRSVPIAKWNGEAGKWENKKNWKFGQLPKPQDTVRIQGKGEAIISEEVNLKQPLILATHNNSGGYLRISKKGVLNQSANGELLIGYNRGGKAKLLIEGTLRKRGRAFIGRNNAESSVVIDGGIWDSAGALVRMPQYNSKEDTQSLLEIKHGGKFMAKALEMINDESVVELVDGYIELERLTIGGDNGTAVVNHHAGILRVDNLKFGSVDSRYYITGVEAELWLKGDWSIDQLLSIENSTWLFQGEALKKDQLQVSQRKLGDKSYSVFKLQ